jgi:glutamine amidotransferase
MFEMGLENEIETEGLGQWPGVVSKLDSPKLPHMGWNNVAASDESALFGGVADQLFYFVHSYAAKEFTLQVDLPFIRPVVSFSEYGEKFIAAVENGPLTGVQFHPEKSGEAGITLLRNWIATL